MRIGNKLVGDGNPCFIIAEGGVNHNGELYLAKKMIRTAKKTGADAIKFQTFKADELASEKAEKAEYQKDPNDINENQLSMLRKLEFSETEHQELKHYADENGIIFLSSAFDPPSIKLLSELDVPAYKIPSGEIDNIPYLRTIADYNRPIILSTGMATLSEIDTAINEIHNRGNNKIILLQCITSYPPDYSEMNLKTIPTMKQTFGVPTGFSDHSMGNVISFAAVALGACVIEKHFTLDKTLDGPDHKASINPVELEDLVRGIRNIENAMGDGVKVPTENEKKIKKLVRKSLFINQDIKKGTILSRNLIEVKRPATGISPKYYDFILGKKIQKSLKKGENLIWEHILDYETSSETK